MNKQKLFELAVGLTAANISAGQFQNGMNFATIVYDDTHSAYEQLEKLWEEISGEAVEEEAAAERSEPTH